MKITPNGYAVEGRHLKVGLTVEETTWMKFATIKIPLKWLASPECLEAMDKEVRRNLIQLWSEVDLSDPLW